MKKITSLLTVASMAIALLVTTPVYAMETDSALAEAMVPVSADGVTDTAVPYGALSGYGQKWHDPAVDGDHGEFNINVTGVPWINAKTTIGFENFRDDTVIYLEFWGPFESGGKRQRLYKTPDSGIAVKDWHFDSKQFNFGLLGNYTIRYQIKNNNCPGRINCWIW